MLITQNILTALRGLLANKLRSALTILGIVIGVFSVTVIISLGVAVKAGIIGVAIYMLITSVLVRHVLCKFVCAAGLMQMLFGWISPLSLRLRFDTGRISECTDCRGCDRACFMNVVPRKNKRDISCVNCGACVAACRKELGNDRGLFQLGFGTGTAAAGNRAPSSALETAYIESREHQR